MTALRIPTPDAVRYFAAQHLPAAVVEANALSLDAERVLRRPMSPLSVEDLGDRETVLAEWHRADKRLGCLPLRPKHATEVLS